jgi:hypothetical protein
MSITITIGEPCSPETLSGGTADFRSEADFDPTQLQKGIEHELEHTTEQSLAKEIAMDHLAEDPLYYEKLENIE